MPRFQNSQTVSYGQRGYLKDDFRVFHLKDKGRLEFEFHYHDFDKIIIFLSGKVTYLIEGRSYVLKPYDIILVGHNEIHRPLIDTSVLYERIIVYLSPNFLEQYKSQDCDLSACFDYARNSGAHVLRVREPEKRTLLAVIRRLEAACKEKGYGAALYCRLLFLEFLIHLNRTAQGSMVDYEAAGEYNQKILDVMEFINENLEQEMDVGTIARQAYMSRYHFMRLFKQETGYTVGHYLTSKRLLMARELLEQDIPITEICYRCGFQTYSAFSRAYKKEFGEAPRDSRKRGVRQDGQ